ncbi:hypothetical protein PENANT_c023G03933 [Penicillium antarcticum]|uniref:Uncharacterized protein n=1 Tax=Penicillium antarcticum TaxID=416450 RepID=A0A1V6PYK2_9EURO|nr:hypothetical protein PENANT_c023G03933 [Penicillium antarcticum]
MISWPSWASLSGAVLICSASSIIDAAVR